MGGIYLIQDGGGLVEMSETAYDSEDVLQGLLATYPSLLAGDQVDSAAPRRWLLISREIALASEEGGAGRWSIDHVFLDQDGVPTLVEVKRSTDTRIRREVVGQMLDYAANAVVYWPVEQMQASFGRRCAEENRDPLDVLAESLGAGIDMDEFWQRAKTNLLAGKIRMVFVADKIPADLQRIVEFLNGQMDPAQVLAVEVRQFAGQGQRAMVPRVLGQTAKAQQKKASLRQTAGRWDEETFLRALEDRNTPDVAAAGRRVLEWAKDRGLVQPGSWGRGRVDGTFSPAIGHAGQQHQAIRVYTNGKVEVPFGTMKSRPPFDDESKRREFCERLNRIGGVNLPPDCLDLWPGFHLAALTPDADMRRFLDTLDWFFQEARASGDSELHVQ